MWNQSLGMVQNQNPLINDYGNLAMNVQKIEQNVRVEMNAQLDGVNKVQDQVDDFKIENSILQNEIVIPKPQQDLKFSSSQGESQQQISDQQKTKKVNKKSQKMPSHAAYKKYSRITPEVKQQLINLIARQNMSIKDASSKLKINYSSAKFIFSRYRDKKLQIIDQQMQKDEVLKDLVVFRKIQQLQQVQTNETLNRIVVKCSSGGKFQAQTDKVFNLKEIYQLYHDSNNGPFNKLENESD